MCPGKCWPGQTRDGKELPVPPLNRTGETLALADSGNVHQLAGLKPIDQNSVASLGFIGGVLDAHFTQTPHRRGIGLLEVPHHGFRDSLRLDEFHQA